MSIKNKQSSGWDESSEYLTDLINMNFMLGPLYAKYKSTAVKSSQTKSYHLQFKHFGKKNSWIILLK